MSELRIECPRCDNTSMKGRYDPRCYVNIEKSVWKCFRCQESGHINELDEDLDVIEEVEKFELDISVLNGLQPVTSYLPRFLDYEIPEGLLYYTEDKKNLVIVGRDWSNQIRSIKYRSIEGPKSFHAEPGSEIGVYFLLATTRPESILVTEAEIDAITARLLGYPGDILALQTTTIKNEVVERLRTQYKTIHFALDNDAAGRRGTKEIIKQFQFKQTKVLEFPSECKDVNEVLLKLGKINAEVWLRRQISDDSNPSIASYNDLKDKVEKYIFDKEPEKYRISTGFNHLDDHLNGGLYLGGITVLHSRAKEGKTTFLNQLIFNALNQGYKIGLASFEMEPATSLLPTLHNMFLNMHVKKEALRGNVSKDDLKQSETLLNNIFFYNRDIVSVTLDSVIAFIEECAHRGVKLIGIDHSLFLAKSAKDSDEHMEIYLKLAAATRKFNVHTVIVAQAPKLLKDQPLSMDTVYGGKAAGMVTHNFITIQRSKNMPLTTELRIEGVRDPDARLTYDPILLSYDPETRRLLE